MYAGNWKNYQEYADATDLELIAQREERQREREKKNAEKAEYLEELMREEEFRNGRFE